MPTIEELQAELAREREQMANLLRVARREAEAHSLCHVMDNIVAEAGVNVQGSRQQVTFTAQVTLSGYIRPELQQHMNEANVRNAIKSLFRVSLNPEMSRHYLRSHHLAYGGNQEPMEGQDYDLNIEVVSVDSIGDPTVAVENTQQEWIRVATSATSRVYHYTSPVQHRNDDYRRLLCTDTGFGRQDWYSPNRQNRLCLRCSDAIAAGRTPQARQTAPAQPESEYPGYWRAEVSNRGEIYHLAEDNGDNRGTYSLC